MTRKFKMIAALITMFALFATGTFAWQIVIEKNNEFTGNKKDVTVHDDFDPDAGLKDVYVENRGNTTIFVRVKLSETMNLTSDTWRPGAGDWVTHTYGTSAEDCGHRNRADNALFHDYFKWTMGGWKYYRPSSGSSTVAQDTHVYNGSEPGVLRTPDAQIITSAEFLAKTEEEQKSFIGWIYSTDGYAYWSQPLKKGEVTGLLLHGVQPQPILHDLDYYYAINVQVEIVDRRDVPMWTQGAPSVDGSGTTHDEATPDGKEVILIIVGGDGPVGPGGPGDPDDPNAPSVTLSNIPTTVMIGGVVDPPTVTVGPAGSPTSPLIWASDDENIATVDADGKVTGLATGSAAISVTAPNGITATYTITVTEPVTDTRLPVITPPNGVFVPITDPDPMRGDGYYAMVNFKDYDNPEKNELYHYGSVHLEDIISDGIYSGVTATAVDAKFAPYITIGPCDRHGNKPSIIFSYEPTNQEWYDAIVAGDDDTPIPVQVLLTRDDGKSAIVTIVMIYPYCLVSCYFG